MTLRNYKRVDRRCVYWWSSDLPRSLCFMWFWFGLEILRRFFKILNGFYFVWSFIQSVRIRIDIKWGGNCMYFLLWFFSNSMSQIFDYVLLPTFKSSQVHGRDLAKFLDEWIEHPTANANIVTVSVQSRHSSSQCGLQGLLNIWSEVVFWNYTKGNT